MYRFYLILLLLVALPAHSFERESFYSDKICTEQLGGEVTILSSGLRPDCETAFAVIEFDWAKSPKHYECIGQALVYAWYTKKLPVCVLLARNEKEWEFAQKLTFAFQRAQVIYIPRKLF